MNYTDYLNIRDKLNHSTRLNEAVRFKVGDLATYKDKWGETVGLLIVGELSDGYIATTGGMIGAYTPKSAKNFKSNHLGTCVWLDSNGKVNGKTPAGIFNGSFDQFCAMLDGEDYDEDEDDEDEDY